MFENAAELEAYKQGKSNKFLYSRYANPTVQAVEEKLAVLEGAEAALVTSSGMAATATALFGLLQAGDEVDLQRGDLRRHAAHHHGFPDAVRRGVTVRVARGARASPSALIGPATKRRVVRVADQPDAAVCGHRARARGVPGARRDFGRSTTRLRVRSISSRWRSASTW